MNDQEIREQAEKYAKDYLSEAPIEVANLAFIAGAKWMQERENLISLETQPKEVGSRCCGMCDGENDICVADMVCEPHKKIGCEICYGER